MSLTEDDVYRSSTQYRLWSFTRSDLTDLRSSTNKSAEERVIIAIKRARAQNESLNSNGDSSASMPPRIEIDCLTPAEASAIVSYYTSLCLRMSDSMKFPTNVKATAAQYLKRFYLYNSPMTYHPKSIFPTCLFLATKTENHFTSLSRFAENMQGKLTAEDIVAPEFILTQGLRFTFDVRHPQRGLAGGLIELLAMARAEEGILLPSFGKSAKYVQQEMMALTLPTDHEDQIDSPKALESRCGAAFTRAKEVLATDALITDVYFLYTPAQIWLAAMHLADHFLTEYYLTTKISQGISSSYHRVLTVIKECAQVLSEHASAALTLPREELVRIDKKLYKCLNPEKRDLVGLNRAQKRDGLPEGAIDAHAVKKRKLERENSERDGDVFGGPLIKMKDNGET